MRDTPSDPIRDGGGAGKGSARLIAAITASSKKPIVDLCSTCTAASPPSGLMSAMRMVYRSLLSPWYRDARWEISGSHTAPIRERNAAA
jgi:hypothetical protein